MELWYSYELPQIVQTKHWSIFSTQRLTSVESSKMGSMLMIFSRRSNQRPHGRALSWIPVTSLPSRDNPNTPVSGMVENMMTEEWYTYTNYSACYDPCQTTHCRYTYDAILPLVLLSAFVWSGNVVAYDFLIERDVTQSAFIVVSIQSNRKTEYNDISSDHEKSENSQKEACMHHRGR